MKLIRRLLLTAVIGLGMVNLASAAQQGPYLGMQAGATNTHNTTQSVNVQTTDAITGNIISNDYQSVNPSNKGFGVRVFTGYNFNPYFALEGGWTHYGLSTYSPNGTSCNSANATFTTPCNNPSIRTNGFDFEGKGILQLQIPYFSFGLFGKVGFAALQVSYAGSLTANNVSANGSGTSIKVRPLAALGLSYDLTQNWQFDLTASRVFRGGTFQNADMIALGLSYHFFDAYCGQFLC